MKKSDFIIVKNKDYPFVGRCVYCEARDYCGSAFNCECNLKEHYKKNIKKERKLKLQKIYGLI